VRSLARGSLDAPGLSPTDRAMLDYAVALTRDPGAVGPDDIDELRSHGFGDTAIHDICHVAAYYNYVNRIADGLGVELEARWTDEELTVTRQDVEAARGER
jgi:uncharacterized peroxidase-related enzyme